MHNYARRLFHELTHPLKAALDGSLSGPSTISMAILCQVNFVIFPYFFVCLFVFCSFFAFVHTVNAN